MYFNGGFMCVLIKKMWKMWHFGKISVEFLPHFLFWVWYDLHGTYYLA